MTKNDFLNNMNEYIDTLAGTELKGEELAAWIQKESKDFGENLTEQEIRWIVEEVERRA